MRGYELTIIIVSSVLLIFTILSLIFMCIYNADKFGDVKKYEICRKLTLIGSCLCAIWNPLILVIMLVS